MAMPTAREMSERIKARKREAPKRRSPQYAPLDICVRELEANRAALGLPNRRLATILDNRDPANVYKWFSGRRSPHQKCLIRLLHLTRILARGEFDLRTFDPTCYWRDHSFENLALIGACPINPLSGGLVKQ